MDVGLKQSEEKKSYVRTVVSILPKMDVGLKRNGRPKANVAEMFQSYLKWMWV